MRAQVRAASRHAGALGPLALMLCLSSCGLLPRPHPAEARTLTLPEAHPSVLIVITDPDSPAAMRETASLIAATARAGERVVILDDHAGTALATSTAPAPPSVGVPAPPSPLPRHPTSFQKARYATAVRQYGVAVQRAEARLRQLQEARLTAWAARTAASAETHLTGQDGQGADIADIDASLGAAAADLSSLRQAGVGGEARTVIAVIGVSEAAAQSVPVPPAGLQASTVVVDDFAGDSGAEAAWQASLLQAGASRVMLLTRATGDELASLVRHALDATVTDALTNVLFGLGQYKLEAAALPQLRRLLRLLTVQYPNATATIIGYTDDLPTPGGNLRLSQLRAQAIAEWLVSQGVAGDRLQAFGYGDADPVAPNTPAGQPLNRRVDVIIDPSLS
jgi:outer membrane protein OmpA-like peptidoglycan-associated protein